VVKTSRREIIIGSLTRVEPILLAESDWKPRAAAAIEIIDGGYRRAIWSPSALA